MPQTLAQGDVEVGFSESDLIVEGEVYIGGQEHFYMEPNACIVTPKGDNGELEVCATTQMHCAVQVV